MITVRPVERLEEYRACQEVQRKAWGITEDGYLVPVATMISVQHAGGLVLGAFEGERLVGFAFGYLGRVHGRWALYSQLAGVDPSIQSSGAGGLLKQAQRAWARQQGLALVAWTYDPLQAGNANFNLHRLGACSHTYQVNYFGERSDLLNAGLDTDRLLVEWGTDAPPPPPVGADPLTEVVRLVSGRRRRDGLLEPVASPAGGAHMAPGASPAGNPAALQAQIAIPPDIAALKAADPALAGAWQQAVRAAFQQAFAAGLVAVDFARQPDDDGLQMYYVLRPASSGTARQSL